jgi:hypothetical protein
MRRRNILVSRPAPRSKEISIQCVDLLLGTVFLGGLLLTIPEGFLKLWHRKEAGALICTTHFIKENVMKKIVVALMIGAFVLSAGAVFAAKCKVDSIDGEKATITCDKVDFKVGDNVTVKAKKALEGC